MMSNTPRNKYLIDGEELSVNDISKKYLIPTTTLQQRIRKLNIKSGEDIKDALMHPSCTGYFGDQLVMSGTTKTLLIDTLHNHMESNRETIVEYLDSLLEDWKETRNPKAMKEYLELAKWASPKVDSIREPNQPTAIQMSVYNVVPNSRTEVYGS